jgi:hypothetical protein
MLTKLGTTSLIQRAGWGDNIAYLQDKVDHVLLLFLELSGSCMLPDSPEIKRIAGIQQQTGLELSAHLPRHFTASTSSSLEYIVSYLQSSPLKLEFFLLNPLPDTTVAQLQKTCLALLPKLTEGEQLVVKLSAHTAPQLYPVCQELGVKLLVDSELASLDPARTIGTQLQPADLKKSPGVKFPGISFLDVKSPVELEAALTYFK